MREPQEARYENNQQDVTNLNLLLSSSLAHIVISLSLSVPQSQPGYARLISGKWHKAPRYLWCYDVLPGPEPEPEPETRRETLNVGELSLARILSRG